jgi:hypothetical protein
MDHSHLRLFNPNGSEQTAQTQLTSPTNEPLKERSSERTAVTYSRVIGEARVAVSVGDLLPILAEAWESRRAWLGDFSSDRVIVSQDLYEIMLAYKRLSKVAS